MTTKDGKVSKAAMTKERVLKTALETFEAQGFDKTSMRDLAKFMNMSLGAFYYHFKNKEEIVQVYYENTFDLFAEKAQTIFDQTPAFEARLAQVLELRMKSFQSHRELLIALSRSAVDPHSPLSPFSEEQTEIRRKMIGIFETMIRGSDLKVDKKLAPYVPTLLWMYLMGILFFWVYDESKQQQKTYLLIEKLTPLIVRLLRFSRFPLTGGVIKPIVEVLTLMIKT